MMSYWSDPAENVVAVTPNDSTDIAVPSRGLLCGVAGNAQVTTAAGQTVTIPLQQGYNPIRVRRVWSTSTTATGIFALY
jgi:hypothetical protein